REPYESYGDRPYVVFPCGLAKLNRNELLIMHFVFGHASFCVLVGLYFQ
ncbi:MAG TPA: hypothetical protein EYP47_01280, partial [Methanococcaceae archaeon]|nr:hypothetical protein [Methanococcaceae archaeon]